MKGISGNVFLLLAASGACSAFGGLQSIAILEWLQPLLLLQFLHHAKILDRKWSSALGLLLLTLLTQTLGYTISYAGEFKDPYFTFSGVFKSFFVCFFVWVILLFVFISSVTYEKRFPAAVLSHPFAFPVIWTMAWHTASSFSAIGTTGNPAYTQHAIQPIVLTVSLWGLDGIVFFMALTASLVHKRLQLRQEAGQESWTITTGSIAATISSGQQNRNLADDPGEHHKLEIEDHGGVHEPTHSENFPGAGSGKPTTKEFVKKVRSHDRLVKLWCSLLIMSLLYSGGRQVIFSGSFFEKGIEETTKPTVGVSCILRQYEELSHIENQSMGSLEIDGRSKEFLWNATSERARAGDAFIVWSETATIVDGQEGEDELLSKAREILSLEQERRTQHKLRQWTDNELITSDHGPYLGLSYAVLLENRNLGQAASTSNVFTLMLPDGSIGFRFEKANPVPFFEPETVPGPGELKAIDTPFGRVGAAICFDYQFPRLLKQASYLGVDIMLQPSWTWGPMANFQFKADAFRAVENGFTMVRCSSTGQSGIITPYNEIVDLRESTETSVVTMLLPIASRIWTLYAYGGFLFAIALSAVGGKYLFMSWLPLSWVLAVSNIFPGAVNQFFVGDTFEEEVIGKKTYRRYKTKPRNSTEWTVARRPSLISSRSFSTH